MKEQSRLDAALDDHSAGGEWYRSPLVLVAGLILFLGALALVVLGVTGGDDTATAADDTASAVTATAADDTATAADGDATAATVPAKGAALTPVEFGGVNIPEVDTVSLAGDVLPPVSNSGDDPAIGTLAPEITATSLATGSPITLGPGRARVIGFFAHWCPHCQAELPEITDWLANTALPPNTEFIAVSTAVDEGNGNYPPSAWFNEVGFNSPVIVDDERATLLNGMGFGGFPAFVAIDASGVVVDRAGGNIGTEGLAALFDNFAGAASS